ncbi:MAG TPA: AarF/UbiB family protein [Candidatus Binatia bacterium]|jgi:ubiquinone biosynthesis protein|nr:AarF/UbiB family protein [Candidatus Binatia bacterium]
MRSPRGTTPLPDQDKRDSLLGIAARDIERLTQVTATLVRHGFGALVGRGADADGAADATSSQAVRFARLLADLGPTFIKLGQVLSIRRDLLPTEYIAALESLQDNAPEVPFTAIREVVEVGLGQRLDAVFSSFDERALGTASIAQTHRAIARDGTPLVVKVQRPGIERVLRGDLDLLYLAARALETGIDEMQLAAVSEVIVEFEKGLLRELDFTSELENLELARRLLDPARDVVVPRPYREYSCRTVLAMEFFPGRSLRSLEPSGDAAKHAVEELVQAAVKQVFVDGFFHGDPHPGNVLVGTDRQVCLIDFGLAGHLDQSQRDDLVTLILAVILGDDASIARVLLRMGTSTQRVSLADLRAEVGRIRTTYLTAASIEDVDSSGFAEAFGAAANRFRIKLAPEYAILTKATATLEGIIRTYHPHIDLVAIARPVVERLVAGRWAPTRLLADAMTGATGMGSLLRGLPSQLEQLLQDVETGNLQVRAVSPALDELPMRIHQLASRLSLTGFAAALSICTALLVPPELRFDLRSVLCVLCLVLAASGWTTLLWWHVLGRGRPVSVTAVMKLLRRS